MLGLGNNIARSSFVSVSGQWSIGFDGADDAVLAPDGDAVIGTGGSYENITIATWFRTHTSSTEQQLISFRKTNTTSTNLGILLNKNDSDFPAVGNIGILTYNGSSHLRITYDASTDDNRWIHFAAVVTTNNVKLYIDGSEVVDASATPSFDNQFNDEPITIGARFAGDSSFAGEIADLALYDAALTSGNISTIYNSRAFYDHASGVGSSDLQAWYRMGDGTEAGAGSTLYDMSSNSHNATLYSGAYFNFFSSAM